MLTLDDLDRMLIHALQVDGRAPFTTIARVLDTSTQTVVRRYRRLHAAGLRVVALADPRSTGAQQWVVRISAATGTARDIGRALARRPDTSWVRLTSGGTEIVAIIQTVPGGPDSHALLLHDIPRTTSITAVSAHYLLHMYVGGPAAWPGRVQALTDDQQSRLRPPAAADPPEPLSAGDAPLLTALERDARASYAELAVTTGWATATVARRLAELRERGTVFFDVDIDPTLVGITASALLWLSVAPAHLERVAQTLATHTELAVVAATTGPTNLTAHALCADAEALHHYLTHKLAIEAITRIETAPVLRTLKAATTIRP